MQSGVPNRLLGRVDGEGLYLVVIDLLPLVALFQKLLQLLFIHGLVELLIESFGKLYLVGLLVLLDVGLVVVWVEGSVDQEVGLELRVCDFEEVIEHSFDHLFGFLASHDGIGKVDSAERLEIVDVIVVFVLYFEQVPNSSSDHFHNPNHRLYQDVIFGLSDQRGGYGEDEIGSQKQPC